MNAARRVVRAWRTLSHERRLAAGAAIGLFVSLFLPWYQETVVIAGKSPATASLTGWASFSFFEAAVLLAAAGVLALLFERAEGRGLRLAFADGWAVTVAGGWACLLIVWRILDKQSTHVSGPGATVSGVEWGIFLALAVAGTLFYAGSRMRQAGAPVTPPDAAAPGDRRRGPEIVARRARARPRTAQAIFPAVGPLADPPTLRFGDEPAAPVDEVTDEQLTIPFEEPGGP